MHEGFAFHPEIHFGEENGPVVFGFVVGAFVDTKGVESFPQKSRIKKFLVTLKSPLILITLSQHFDRLHILVKSLTTKPSSHFLDYLLRRVLPLALLPLQLPPAINRLFQIPSDTNLSSPIQSCSC